MDPGQPVEREALLAQLEQPTLAQTPISPVLADYLDYHLANPTLSATDQLLDLAD